MNLHEQETLTLLLENIPTGMSNGVAVFKAAHVDMFVQNLQKSIDNKDSAQLMQKRGLCVDKVVDVIEFAESSYYFNQKDSIRPVIKEALWKLFHTEGDPYVEAVLTGAIGIGKNYMADIAMAYMLYKLSCFHNPQVEFGLAPGSSIIFIQQSKTVALAKKVVFEQFTERLKRAPYFKEHFPYDAGIKSELRFPKNVYLLPVGGSESAAIGMNVYGGLIDEMNFMARVTDSEVTKFTGEYEYDQAERAYLSLIRRMKSRFLQHGKIAGKLMLISSVAYPGDFTDRKADEAKKNKSIFVMKHSQWEALPASFFTGPKFRIEVGNDLKQSSILKEGEVPRDPEDVVEVPIEYKEEFERDIDGALRDLGGIATGTRKPFIPYREMIQKAQEDFMLQTAGIQLFNVPTCVIQEVVDADTPEWERIVNMAYIEECLLDKTVTMATHVDVALSEDAAGLAIGHISGYKTLPSTRYWSTTQKAFVEVTDIKMPIYTIDGVLQIKAPVGGEIDLELIKDLVLFLRQHLQIKWGTMDSYQSAMMIQAFRKVKIRSGVLSVDTSMAPYTEVKLALKDERLLMPKHEVAAKELREVERVKDKVDHPTKGSKDCADAIAGVVFMLQQKEMRGGSATRRKQHVDAEKAPDVRKVRVSGTRKRLR